MPNCCVPGCKEPAHHNVPKDRDHRLQWLHAIQRMDLLDSEHPYRICKNHFTRNDYREPDSPSKRSMLKRDAVPSVFSWSKPSTSSTGHNETVPPVLVAPSFSDVGLTNFTNYPDELHGTMFLMETPAVGVNEVIKIPQQKIIVSGDATPKVIITGREPQNVIVTAYEPQKAMVTACEPQNVIVTTHEPQKVTVAASGSTQQKVIKGNEALKQKVIVKASETKKKNTQVGATQPIAKPKIIDKNKEYWRLKLMHIIHRPRFCGVCLDFDVHEMDSVNDLFEIVVNERVQYKTLLDIAEGVFKETENIANSFICRLCSKKLIQAYILIQNYKESSKMLNNFLDEIYNQACTARTTIRGQKKSTEAYISLTGCYFGSFQPTEQAQPQKLIVTSVSTPKPAPVELKASSLLASYKAKLQNARVRQNNHICKKCGTILNSERALMQHYKMHTKIPTKIGSFACPYCDMAFSNQRFCEAHKSACGAHKRAFLCNACAATFDTMMELTNHIKLKHAKPIFRCTLCEKAFFSEPSRDEHMEQVHGNKKHCVVCQKNFFSVADLLVHMRTHRPEVKYTCSICKVKFDDLPAYRSHCANHISPTTTCKICNKEMKKNLLKKHMAVKHKKPVLKCTTCGEVFQHSVLLKYHQIVHLPGMPYPKYELLVNPDRPRRTEEEDIKEEPDPLKISNPDATGETTKPQQKTKYCQFCDYKTKSYTIFKSHMNRNHLKIKPFVCSTCNKAYISKKNLRNHMAIHTGDRVECPICKKEVPERNLKLHMRCHMEDHPYSCGLCGKTFVSSKVFEQHKLTHAKTEPSGPSEDVIMKDPLE